VIDGDFGEIAEHHSLPIGTLLSLPRLIIPNLQCCQTSGNNHFTTWQIGKAFSGQNEKYTKLIIIGLDALNTLMKTIPAA
jgi:hypothetical protein